jgi:hypothetical protein
MAQLFRHRWDRPRVWAVLVAVVAALAVGMPSSPTWAQAKGKDKKEKVRGAPEKKVEPLVSKLQAISPEARCQAEVSVWAFKRVGAITALSYMSSGLANAAGSGVTAAMGYCVDHPKECRDATAALKPRIGVLPPTCNADIAALSVPTLGN